MMKITELSYWERKSFFDDIDYLIIGAGIVGYSTALHLRTYDPKAKIVILERGFLPSGASSKNAGFACFGSATEILDDLSHIGDDEVWSTLELRWKGLQKLRRLIGDEHLKLHVNGSWDLITKSEIDIFDQAKDALSEFNSRTKEITGIDNIYSVDPDVGQRFGFNTIENSIHNKLEGQIDTAAMNARFYKLIIQNDIKVLFGIEVESIESTSGGVFVHTAFGDIRTRRAAVCTNGFANKLVDGLDLKPARAQVLITSPIDNLSIKGTFHYDRGYYYFRNIDNRILFGGGRNLDFEGETTTELMTTATIIEQLKNILNEVILPGRQYEIDGTWAGIMGVGNTKKPIVENIADNIYCGVRLGGMGVAIGTLIGEQTAELMQL